MKKTFVLDTNILLENPNAIFGFQDNEVVITGTTLQELDSKKSLSGELGYNARQSFRLLESLREKGSLRNGVKLPDGGMLYVEPDGVTSNNLPNGYKIEVADNRIISTCIYIKNHGFSKDEGRIHKERVILVTNDVAMRVNASACGVEVQYYLNDHLNDEKEYRGIEDLLVSDEFMKTIIENKKIYIDDFSEDLSIYPLNTYFAIHSLHDTIENLFERENYENTNYIILARLKEGLNGKYIEIINKNIQAFGINPLNLSQAVILDALLAPVDDISFVAIKGQAGSAKTFLSLAAGLEKTYRQGYRTKIDPDDYDQILITRNNAVLRDEEFGALPGDLEDKMAPLLSPFFDNLAAILRNNVKEEGSVIQAQIDDMFEDKIIDICPLAYMRGRTITNSYLIVDEAQNCPKKLMRDIVTRAGRGTKIVICGDINQIDAHTLDKRNNGLEYAINAMTGSPLFASFTLSANECVRSNLATEALKRMMDL